MISPKDLRTLVQNVNCRIDFDKFCKVYETTLSDGLENPYIQEKWKRFKNNWTNWYCELDDNHAERFLNILEEN